MGFDKQKKGGKHIPPADTGITEHKKVRGMKQHTEFTEYRIIPFGRSMGKRYMERLGVRD